MVLFKINGERNSGTNFLSHILNKNGFPVYIHKSENNITYHWKHGIPSDDYKNLDEKVVDLFIFRNIDDWLMYTYKNFYELKEFNLFEDFLKHPQTSCEKKFLDYRTNRCLNEDDNNKTIFQIREYKFNKIMEYKNRNKDVILINLSFIQNEKNLSQFLDFLSEKYMPNLKVNSYILSINHTKDNSKDKNRNYDINIDEYKDIIDSNKNLEIENFINNLTFIYN
jgi:hypothetical protein